MNKISALILFFLVQLSGVQAVHSQDFPIKTNDVVWSDKGIEGGVAVHLYVYWSYVCPHCERALPYVKQMAKQYPWLKLHLREVSKKQDNLVSLYEMAQNLDEPTTGEVPAFFFCGLMYTGYGENDTTGEWIKETLLECRDQQL